MVSIHAPGRGATNLWPWRRHSARFQFTHPGGVRLQFAPTTSERSSLFQFTHPGGVRPYPSVSNLWNNQSFNSRTREGCDKSEQFAHYIPTIVSIHAPGRGATANCILCLESTLVSIHAPGRGATQTESADSRTLGVSIHAPGRGATSAGKLLRHSYSSFNSRTREGCDLRLVAVLPRLYCFNSRTREGCDIGTPITAGNKSLFQFTHPGGVRQYGAKLRIMGRINKRNLRLEVLL